MQELQELQQQARRVLDRAADHLTRRGWCQGEWFDPHDRACIGGAVHTYAPSPVVESLAMSMVSRAVGDLPDRWQDAPGRTKAEVLDALQRAARAPALV
jgi:hypothetical protein